MIALLSLRMLLRGDSEFATILIMSQLEMALGQDQLHMLVRLGRDITHATSLDQALKIVLETTRQSIPFKGGSIALVDPHGRLYIASALPPVDGEVRALRLPVGEGIMGWIAEHKQPYYSPDLDAEAGVRPSFRSVGGNSLIKSLLGVPLMTQGRCIGVLELDSAEVNAFLPEHQRLLETVAAQVSGAIENARLLEERREFSRRLRMVYSAAHELSSHFDLDFILDEFARRAADLIGARYTVINLFDEQKEIERVITFGLTEQERSEIDGLSWGAGFIARRLTESKPVRLDDIRGEASAIGLPSFMRTLLAAPLVARGEMQGTVYLSEKKDGQPFTPEDEELLMLLATGASAAISNARLYVQLRRNIEQLYALHQIGQAIGSSLSQDEVIQVFDLDVRRLCGAEASVVSEWNPSRNDLDPLNEAGAPDLLKIRERPGVRRDLKEAARSGQAIALPLPAESEESLGGDGARVYGYVAPLTVRGRLSGLAEIYAHNPGVSSPESSSLFLTLAAQLAVSIENARLYSQLQRREQQLRNFVNRLFQAEDGERRRLAYDIHDGLAQLIISADIHMNNFVSIRREDRQRAEGELDKGMKRLKASLTEVRRVVSELRPSTLDDFGLVNTLRRHVEQLAEEQGWQHTFSENLGEEARLDAAIETGVFRIVQESLNNIRKYSRTRRVQVDLREEGDWLYVRVQDWGRGFDLDEARQREGHFGLSSMEERARLLGGSFEIDTHPGGGTVVRVQVPCYHAPPPIHQ